MVGKRLGQYEIVEPLGAGGMGEVYRGRDTRLDRDVAIKLLPEGLADDPDRLARLEREAKLLAALNHPHIATIHSLDEVDGARFLVLELIRGESLAHVLARGPLPVERALDLCRQIAEALEAAHSAGIIHRDLKPANVIVTSGHRAKVLDFGIAKSQRVDPGVATTAKATNLTVAGTLLGTPSYMSPEQVRGGEIDRRADIWAFGCLMYESLTGRCAFARETLADTLAAIVEGEPDWQVLPSTLPAAIETLLRRCLRREPTRRLQHIGDARVELEDRLVDSDEQRRGDEESALRIRERASVEPTLVRRLAPWGAATTMDLLAAAAWLGGGRVREPTSATLPLHVDVSVPPELSIRGGNRDYPLAVSPDGARLAYVATAGETRQLYVESFDGAPPRAVAGTERARFPFFSPDGNEVGFWADGDLWRVPVESGRPVRIAAVPVLDFGADWGPNDTIVFTSSATGLQRVTLDGRIETIDVGSVPGLPRWPRFLRDGSLVFTGPGGVIYALDGRTGSLHELLDWTEGVLQAAVLPSGFLVFGSAGSVLAARIDPLSWEISGTPTVVIEDVFEGGNNEVVHFDVAENGTIVFMPGGTKHSLLLVDRQGNADLLDSRQDAYRHPSLSPDGRHLAITIDDDPNPSNTWVLDIEQGRWEQLTTEGHNLDPHWSRDGSGLSTCSNPGGVLFRRFPVGETDTLLPPGAVDGRSGCLSSWGPGDAQFLLIQRHPERGWDTYLFDRSRAEPLPEPWLVTRWNEVQARISPDGRLVAFTSDASGQPEVYVAPLEDASRMVKVSIGGGVDPQWSPDGRELFYGSERRLMVVDMSEGPTIDPDAPFQLFDGLYEQMDMYNYAVFPDGERFVMIQRDPVGASGDLEMILDWPSELERLLRRQQ